MLSPKYVDSIPSDSRAARADGFLQEDQVIAQQEKIRALDQVAKSQSMPLHQMAIQFILKHPALTSAIIGARNVAQLDDTLAALDAPALSEATLKSINSIAPAQKSRDAEA